MAGDYTLLTDDLRNGTFAVAQVLAGCLKTANHIVPQIEVLMSLVVKVYRNSFNLNTFDGACVLALYAGTANFNHSCVPNCTTIFGDGSMRVIPMYDISVDEELCIPYHEASEICSKRNDFLQHQYGFRCACPLCATVMREDFDNALSEVMCNTHACTKKNKRALQFTHKHVRIGTCKQGENTIAAVLPQLGYTCCICGAAQTEARVESLKTRTRKLLGAIQENQLNLKDSSFVDKAFEELIDLRRHFHAANTDISEACVKLANMTCDMSQQLKLTKFAAEGLKYTQGPMSVAYGSNLLSVATLYFELHCKNRDSHSLQRAHQYLRLCQPIIKKLFAGQKNSNLQDFESLDAQVKQVIDAYNARGLD